MIRSDTKRTKEIIENSKEAEENHRLTFSSKIEEKKVVEVNITEENFFEHNVKRDVQNLFILLKQFYQKGKIYTVSLNKSGSSGLNENLLQDYEFIKKNFKTLKKDQILLFIKAILYFEIKDIFLLESLSKFNDLDGNIDSAFCILYSFAKLQYLVFLKNSKYTKKIDIYNSLFNKSIFILDSTNITKSDKNMVIPIVWALSELNFFKKDLFEKIDEFIIFNSDLLNEYEISIMFRAYSKLFYYKLDVLEKLISRCLAFCENMSLRYIIIISKCLSELSIKNLNLLSGIQERLLYFLKNEKEKDFDQENIINCDHLAQILNNFVKLDFIDYKNYLTLENLFFEKLSRGELKNKESIFSILNAHFIYFKKMYYGVADQIKGNDKKKSTFLKIRREVLNENEEFFHKFFPYLMNNIDTMNFRTSMNVIILTKNTFIYKRKNLRNLNEFYIHTVKNFLNPDKIHECDILEVDKFISDGFMLFQMQGLRDNIINAFTECQINVDKYIANDKIKNIDQSKEELIDKKENNNL